MIIVKWIQHNNEELHTRSMKDREEEKINEGESLNIVGPSSDEEIIEDSDDEESVIVSVENCGDETNDQSNDQANAPADDTSE